MKFSQDFVWENSRKVHEAQEVNGHGEKKA